jgi:hypothetical protein
MSELETVYLVWATLYDREGRDSAYYMYGSDEDDDGGMVYNAVIAVFADEGAAHKYLTKYNNADMRAHWIQSMALDWK